MEQQIINWNCRGFRKNIDEIKMILRDYDPVAFCFQETYTKQNTTIEFRKFNSYFVHSEAIDGRASGGVTIMVKKTIPHRQIIIDTNLQAVAVSLSLQKTITICTIYIPPSYSLGGDELDKLVEQLPSPYILLGDLNAHNISWGNSDTNSKGKKVEKFIADNDLCLWNDGSPTYIHPATGCVSAIDLSICSPSLFIDFDWEVHDDLCGSDHFPTFLHYNGRATASYIPRWNFKKADWSEFSRICEMELTPEIIENINDDKADIFTSTLHFISEITIPKTSAVPKKLHKPWWNDECEEAYKARKKSLHFFRKHPSHDNLVQYRLDYARARRIIRQNMKNTWKEYVSKLNSRTPINKAWDMIRKISGKSKFSGIKHINKDDEIITNVKDISNTLAHTISTHSSSSNYTNKFQHFKNQIERKRLDFASNNNEVYNKRFSIRELEDSLAKAHDTATGPDEIHYQIIKHMPYSTLEALLDIYNDIWDGGEFPSSWREATVIPIAKPGKDPTSPGNYRPIALTSCICKTFERMVNARLVWFLEANAIITAYQSGFRKSRSTIDQLIRLESAVRETFIRREHMVAIFFDLEKAYDTTWKYGIMKDLYDAGLRGNMPTFISNFLTDRKFSVRVGSTLSDLYDQEEGVPQGSILSVTLFSMKINSIVKCLSNDINCSLYVDDFLICYQSKSMNIIERHLQLCLNKLSKWADENGFKFSRSKTVCMHFCQLRKFHLDPVLTLNNIEIPVVKETKFLGLIFDSKLSFIPHIKYLKTKCTKALNLLKVVSRFDWGADRAVLLRLYRALIRSKLDYGSVVYGSARKSYIQMLDTIHHQGLRISTGAFRTSPVESLYVESNEESLYRRRERLTLQYTFKLRSTPTNPTFDTVFNPRYSHIFAERPLAIPTFGIRVQFLIDDMGIDMDGIKTYRIPDNPIWNMVAPTVLFDLKVGKKSDINPIDFQGRFHVIQDRYRDHQFIYTDGSKDGNRVGCAIVSGRQYLMVRLPDAASIYTAELHAICVAMEYILGTDNDSFMICVDSMSCLQAIESLNIDNPIILNILELYGTLKTKQKNIVLCWVPSHVGIRGNELADDFAKDALNENITYIALPFSDYSPAIKEYVRMKWSDFWSLQTENKLHSVQPNLGIWPKSCRESRREEMVLCRIRIGHAYTTHRYLLAGEDPPECISCQERLTVSHLLVHCSEYIHIRNRFYEVDSVQELMDTVEPSLIIAFLKEAGLYFLI